MLATARSTDLLKVAFHSAVVLSIAAPMFLLWAAWRVVTGVAALPPHLYQAGDDLVFNFYQRVLIILIEDIVGCKAL
ncbi:hypothetical protein IscW_ISCW009036 [Ixodes scapularis]|uniref:Uncharacterized protein n=1 Tax=Ixodes scapularis TaxID=6945 RepID=B7PYQ2_IXOSC|nr:hypothetical protein IscW_ISCW009036 [Ixodes scapularis]|eukprot:XP_002403616.1 hypothetical protein IscW_ISCW009036 [Ixodes scapularis]